MKLPFKWYQSHCLTPKLHAFMSFWRFEFNAFAAELFSEMYQKCRMYPSSEFRQCIFNPRFARMLYPRSSNLLRYLIIYEVYKVSMPLFPTDGGVLLRFEKWTRFWKIFIKIWNSWRWRNVPCQSAHLRTPFCPSIPLLQYPTQGSTRFILNFGCNSCTSLDI